MGARRNWLRRATDKARLWGTAVIIGLSLLPEFFGKK